MIRLATIFAKIKNISSNQILVLIIGIAFLLIFLSVTDEVARATYALTFATISLMLITWLGAEKNTLLYSQPFLSHKFVINDNRLSIEFTNSGQAVGRISSILYRKNGKFEDEKPFSENGDLLKGEYIDIAVKSNENKKVFELMNLENVKDTEIILNEVRHSNILGQNYFKMTNGGMHIRILKENDQYKIYDLSFLYERDKNHTILKDIKMELSNIKSELRGIRDNIKNSL